MALTLRAIAACIVGIALAGCTSAPSAPDDAIARQKAYFADLAEHAESNGASDTQITALRDAAASGELTTQTVTELYGPLFDCFAALGGKGEIFDEVTVAPGIVVPDYRVGFSEEADTAGGSGLDDQITACKDRYVEFVWQALYMQPKAVDARNAQMMAALPAIRECLDSIDVALSADPTPDEVANAVSTGVSLGTKCYSPVEADSS